MNKSRFLIENITRKFLRGLAEPGTLLFYLRAYAMSPFRKKKHIDAYAVSYPKCGRTWLRMLYTRYVQESMQLHDFSPGLLDRHEGVPYLAFEHDQSSWVPAPVHYSKIKPPGARYKGTPVVFIIRDPRDVLVSSYMHLRYREKLYRKEISSFIRDPYLGADKIIRFFNVWAEWMCERGNKSCVISYEDLHDEPGEQLKLLLAAVGFTDIEDPHVEKAVERSTFETMKKLEREGRGAIPWLKPGDASDDRTYKTRRGEVGGHREVFSREDMEYLDGRISGTLSEYYSRYYLSMT